MTSVEDHVGPYRLLTLLGEGGMGVVHRALDAEGRDVAVKLVRPEFARDAAFRHRLAREVDTMRRVHSPHVAEVLDADVAAERPYVVTRFIDGLPLDDAIRAHGPLSGGPLGRVAAGLADALAAIHAAGVVHRDLKPNNVMLVGGAPVVIDFGIAHTVDATRLTRTGMIVGTPGYMGPEIVNGVHPGPPLDVYGWAATVTFAATGRSPFGTGSLESVMARIIGGNPALEGVPPRLEPLLRAALNRDPESRPTAAELSTRVREADLGAPAPATIIVPDRLRTPTGAPSPASHFTPPAAPPAAADGVPSTSLAASSASATTSAPPDAPLAAASAAAPPGGVLPSGKPPTSLAAPPTSVAASATVLPDGSPGMSPDARPQEGSHSPADAREASSPSGAPDGRAAASASAGVAATASGRRVPLGVYRVLGSLLIVIAMIVCAVLPVLGVVMAVLTAWYLRAGDSAVRSGRFTVRGAGDVIFAPVRAPGGVVVSTVVLVPVLVYAGIVAGLVATGLSAESVLARDLPSETITSLTALAFGYVMLAGPWLKAPRRQLVRLLSAVAPDRRATALVGAAIVFALVLAVREALVSGQHWWPIGEPYNALTHLTDRVRHLAHHD